jgi:hypothetical protein
MDQDIILDEDDFEILDTDQPITTFSNNCKLNVQFVYRSSLISETDTTSRAGAFLSSGRQLLPSWSSSSDIDPASERARL